MTVLQKRKEANKAAEKVAKKLKSEKLRKQNANERNLRSLHRRDFNSLASNDPHVHENPCVRRRASSQEMMLTGGQVASSASSVFRSSSSSLPGSVSLESFTSDQMMIRYTEGDKYCAYRAASHFFHELGLKCSQFDADSLRMKNVEAFESFGHCREFCGMSWEDFASSEYNMNKSKYDKLIRDVKHYITDLEFKMMTEIHHINVHLFQQEETSEFTCYSSFDVPGASKTICLVKIGDRNRRFKALVPRTNLVSFYLFLLTFSTNIICI